MSVKEEMKKCLSTIDKNKKKKKKKKKNDEKKKKEMNEVKLNIDNIFSNIKVKDKDTKLSEEIEKNKLEENTFTNNNKKDQKNKKSNNKEQRMRTSDGLPIYTFKELKMGKGGYTKDCPFDCNCCF
ncbi:conserved protein, unknown function [Hepatocystis sp. ex Piliocolobus tephrosceles]|nr:conserved protein, unknown function [Hepatocystis sp. ex Piliocolobus tephrosceles]